MLSKAGRGKSKRCDKCRKCGRHCDAGRSCGECQSKGVECVCNPQRNVPELQEQHAERFILVSPDSHPVVPDLNLACGICR